jgi:hypothetical protein
MAGSDAFGTLLNRAINQNRPHLAGAADVGGDFFGRVLLTGYGLTTLTHGHGWQGWAFVAPVLVTGYFTTFYATKKFAHLQVGV